MKNSNLYKKVTVLAAFAVLPLFGLAQEIKVETGNVRIKTGGTVIETKNGNAKIKTNEASKTPTSSNKFGVKNITGSNLKQEIVCNGDDVVITGSENTITVSGYVKSLKITGNDNNIKLDKVISIKALGNENRILYKKSPNKNGKAMISTIGSDNEISKH